MTTQTWTAGYPVHAVDRYYQWENSFGVRFTEWRAVCGHRGHMTGHQFSFAGSARRRELCPTCFTGRHWDGASGTPPLKVESEYELGE